MNDPRDAIDIKGNKERRDQGVVQREEHFWRSCVSTAQFKMNLAWYLSRLAPLLGVYCLILIPVSLIIRREELLSVDVAVLLAMGGLSLIALLAFYSAKPRFLSREDVRIFIESKFRLDTSLSVAQEGVALWPEARQAITRELPRIRIGRWAAFPITAISLLVLAVLVPISKESKAAQRPSVLPPALTETQELIEQLQESELLEENANKELERQLEELMQRPKAEWYDDSMLEATDAFRDEMEAEAAEMLERIERAQDLSTQLAEKADEISQREREDLQRLLEEQMGALSQGKLALDPNALKEMLENAQPGDAQFSDQLSQSLEQLREQLEQSGGGQSGGESSASGESETQSGSRANQQSGEERSEQCSGTGGSSGGSCNNPSANGSSSSDHTEGGEESPGQANSSNKPGESDDSSQAQTSRGPGAAGLELQEKSPQMTSNLQESLSAQKEDQQLEGEVIGLKAKQPQRADALGRVTASGAKVSEKEAIIEAESQFSPDELSIIEQYYR